MKLQTLAESIHKNNVDHGWWNGGIKERSMDEQFANFHSEVTEAWEHWRNKKKVTEIFFVHIMSGEEIDAPAFSLLDNDSRFEIWKPDGIPVELADCVIRILDTAFAYKWHLQEVKGIFVARSMDVLSCALHNEISNAWTEELTKSDSNDAVEYHLSCTIQLIQNFFTENKMDLEQTIETKMVYNRNRSYRHGGKVA